MPEASKTAIVLDSTTYLPESYLNEHEIERISLYVILGGSQRREMEITDLRGFYRELKESKESTTTSQPSVGDFLDVWLPLLADGREIVSIHLASGISGTHETAVQARQRLVDEGEHGQRVHIVDSRSGAGGTGLCVLAAVAEAERGGNPEAVVSRFAEARDGLDIRFAVDTLEYLRRGGRIGGAQALLGTALKIKPILSFREEVVPIDKVRTTSRAHQRLVDFATERARRGPQAWCVQHVDWPGQAAEMVERCRPIFGCEPAFVTEIGPVLGAHSGPGLLGVGVIDASSLDPRSGLTE